MAAGRGGAARHGKSGALLTRGCFLLVPVLLVMTMIVMDKTSALTISRQPYPSLGVLSVRFRGVRSAFMHPTATSFSPPLRNNNAAHRPQNLGGGSISSSLMPPGVASRAPSTRTQEAGPAAPALLPPPHAPRPRTLASDAGSHPQQPTFVSFGTDRASEPRHAKWSRSQASGASLGSGGGWAGMAAPSVQGRRASLSGMEHQRAHLTAGLAAPDPAAPPGRQDTFGLDITEGLSHLDRPTGRWKAGSTGRFPSSGDDGTRGRGPTHPVFDGGYRQTRLLPTGEEEMTVEEGVRSIFDLNTTTEYQPEDYINYHDYDQGRSPEHTQDHKPLTFQHVMQIMNLASQADLHALLEQRGITFDELREFLSSGAGKKDVLEFLKPPTPTTSIDTTTTTTTPPEMSHHGLDTAVVEEGYQDDVRGIASPSEPDHEGEGDDIEQDSKEQTKKNRKKGRKGKGGRRRKNKRRKIKKGQGEEVPDVDPSSVPPIFDTTSTEDPEPWTPGTPGTLPEAPLATTIAATEDTLLPTTQPPAADTTVTSPPSVRTSDVSIVSVSVEEVPSNPYHRAPVLTTVVEDAMPTRRHNTHNITPPLEDRTPRKFPRPARPSLEPDQTVNEIEKVNFVREEQRNDYVFPLRGLLIISGLMGALAVFTLVVLISYAVIKCSKKPVVNNYQVSEQQKPAGT